MKLFFTLSILFASCLLSLGQNSLPQLLHNQHFEMEVPIYPFHNNDFMSGAVDDGFFPTGIEVSLVIDSVGLPAGSEETYEEFVALYGRPADLFGSIIDFPYSRPSSGFYIESHLWIRGALPYGTTYPCSFDIAYLLMNGHHMWITGDPLDECTVDLVESNENHIEANSFSVFQTGVNSLIVEGNHDIEAELKLINLDGSIAINESHYEIGSHINASALSPGLYIIKLATEDGLWSQRLWVD